MQISKAPEWMECWQLNSGDQSGAPKWVLKGIQLLGLYYADWFWIVETPFGKTIAFDGDYVIQLGEGFLVASLNDVQAGKLVLREGPENG